MKHSHMLAALVIGGALTAAAALAQQRGFRGQVPAAAPFEGVVAGDRKIAGLSPIAPTGVSTAPVKAAADKFLAALTPAQRKQVQFAVDSGEWLDWSNVTGAQREGESFADMTPVQREAAYGLLRDSLSAKGYKTSRDIMRLNQMLAEMLGRPDRLGEYDYYFTIMGRPSATEPWGWQLDGHHLVINYFVLGDQIVMTPTFMGSEPTRATSGKYAGTSVLQDEQTKARAFMASLTEAQRREAIVGERGRGDVRGGAHSDDFRLPYEGLRASKLNAAQRGSLTDIIRLYVGNMDDGHAKVKMADVITHLDETYVAWKGGFGDADLFYYRIQSPVILIEFDHQGRRARVGDHVHSVVRTPNGNDYGKDLLRQHYEQYANDPSHGHLHAAPDN